jgi:hypothetical protein
MDSFTYGHKEVWLLLEEAKLDGWQQGFEEGHRTGRKTGQEEGKVDSYEEGYEEGSRKWGEGHEAGYEAGKKMGKEKEETACKNRQLKGYKLSVQHRKDEEQKKWLTEGHGPGLCLYMAAHAHELFRGAVILEEAKVQTEMATWTDVSTQATPTTDEMALQTNDAPKYQYAALQTVPLDDEGPTSLKDARTALCIEFSMQTTTETTEATTQTENDPTANATMSSLTTLAQPPSTTPTTSTTATTNLSPAPKPPLAPQK